MSKCRPASFFAACCKWGSAGWSLQAVPSLACEILPPARAKAVGSGTWELGSHPGNKPWEPTMGAEDWHESRMRTACRWKLWPHSTALFHPSADAVQYFVNYPKPFLQERMLLLYSLSDCSWSFTSRPHLTSQFAWSEQHWPQGADINQTEKKSGRFRHHTVSKKGKHSLRLGTSRTLGLIIQTNKRG